MSKPKILVLQREVEELQCKFKGNQHLLTEAFLQIIHRENIITGNRIRKRHDEPELIPEPVMYQTKNPKKLEWIIDVPKDWVSLTAEGKL
ncbi:hypothetical protein RCF27_09270 [Rhodococcus pyridinivorans]|uniref:hypothetical protein n=1 Tax=Rhodococcus pyridinivorans TaxID=103816 RepID=UPI00280BA273|nr:hypothetical protein [Rhodococcus pyridinivorans]WMM74448.1 hypothetical protein RCF27_09270 [Rhodococcus pyridinivorans]